MIIHLIGSGPQIDYESLPKSIILTTVRSKDILDEEEVFRIRHSMTRPVDRDRVPPSVEWSSGYGTVMRQTRLAPWRRHNEEFSCFVAPMADTVKIQRRTRMLVAIKHSSPNSFVFVSRYNETAVHHFLRGEIIDYGATVLLHRGYDPDTDESLPSEAPRSQEHRDSVWKHLMSRDD